jgi:hypothetical protein
MSQLGALQCQLAGLAALESIVRLAIHALYVTYPQTTRSQLDNERFEITTARFLADVAEDMLVAIDDHRTHVAARLTKLRHPEQIAWPF